MMSPYLDSGRAAIAGGKRSKSCADNGSEPNLVGYLHHCLRELQTLDKEKRRMKANRFFIFLFVLVLGFSGQIFAQKYEIHPYAGGFRGGEWDNQYDLKKKASMA
jgi:hypothetical protein